MSAPALTEGEIAFLLECSESLELLADYHSVQETMADGMDFSDCARYHEEKRIQYRLWAQEAKGREALI